MQSSTPATPSPKKTGIGARFLKACRDLNYEEIAMALGLQVPEFDATGDEASRQMYDVVSRALALDHSARSQENDYLVVNFYLVNSMLLSLASTLVSC